MANLQAHSMPSATIYITGSSALYSTGSTATVADGAILTMVYACGHTTSEPQRRALADGGSCIFLSATCNKVRTCRQGGSAILAGTISSLGDAEEQWLNQASMAMTQADFSANTSLRLFGQAPPVLPVEIFEACHGDEAVAAAMAACGWETRNAAVREMLQGHADYCSAIAKGIVQTASSRASILEQAVLALTTTAISAPGRVPKRLDALATFEASWGKTELARLRATEEGRAILAMDFSTEGILAARAYVRQCEQAESQETQMLASFQEAVRQAFFRDYPGMAAHYARVEAGLPDVDERWTGGNRKAATVPAKEDVLIIELSDSESDADSESESESDSDASSYATAPENLSADAEVDGLTERLPALCFAQSEPSRSGSSSPIDIVAGYCKKDIRTVRAGSRTMSKKMEGVRTTRGLQVEIGKPSDAR